MRQPIESRVTANGVEHAVFEWPGHGPPIVLAHGIGLHARVWDRTIAALPDWAAVFAIDLRGHGRSEKPATPPAGHIWWATFGEDIAAVVAALDLQGVVGVAHSMGGHAMIVAAARQPRRFASLLLLDPTIDERRAHAPLPDDVIEEHPVARRRNQWSSADEMFERLKDRPAFASWDRRVLRDYCEFGLVPSGSGFVLACPPAVEAAVWGGASRFIYEAIEALALPVHIVRAQPRLPDTPPEFAASQTWPGAVAHFRRADDRELAGRSHFFPMESPELIARYIEEAIAAR